MKKLFTLLALCFCCAVSNAQTPVPMAAQPMLTYVETFDSIGFWSNGFTSGAGANRFKAVTPQGTAAIPDPTHTTHNTSFFATQGGGGVQRDSVGGRLLLLATGTTDNTNAAAIDFFMDFSGINAGTLSFDWATFFNGTSSSDRKGSLSVYGSIDGVTFTELSGAEVLNLTNYVPASGTILNVQMPAIFNNAPTARLRFYYYNGTGGTTGSRPFIALNNLKVTAFGTPCVVPPFQPSNLVLSSTSATTVQGSFNAATPAPDQYLVVFTTLSGLTSNPVDGVVYNTGDIVGDGKVIQSSSATSFIADSLQPNTLYHFFVFPLNVFCNGTARYNTINPLNGTVMTPAGPPCIPPATQPVNLQFSNITTTSIYGTFSIVTGASEYLVVASTNSSLSAAPQNGIVYQNGDALGGGTVVYKGAINAFTATNLNHSTPYNFFVFALNNYACSNGPVYNSNPPLTGQQSTTTLLPCLTPSGDAHDLLLSTFNNGITGFFTPFDVNTDGYLVVMSSNSSLSALPADGSVYNPGDNLGGGTIISKGSNYSFHASPLQNGATYYFFVFAYNAVCTGGPLYRTTTFLTGNHTLAPNNNEQYFFGNLHAHSSFSDGNKDSTSYTPSDDYAFAKNSLCMDFLGISEHNHYTATNNPGMLLPKYAPGISEAQNFTIANPNFLAMYGMEWGVISNGGHVVIYGVPQLLGWETLNGMPNYDIYVPKSVYLSDSGLFRTINNFQQSNAFGSLAHPFWTDYDNLANLPYNASADSAISAIAVESGPAFSTNKNYSDPGTDMEFLPYYEVMLSKGYHVAPIIDHDNHYTTFGRTAYTRTAVIASALSEQNLLQSVKQKHCYATQDCDTRVSIKIQGAKMGDSITHGFAPAISISVVDPTNITAMVPVIKLMSGKPGSNILPVAIASETGFSLNLTDATLFDDSLAYYYADITYGGHRTISAPIWYHRKDPPPNAIPSIQNSKKNNAFTIINNPAQEVLWLQSATAKGGTATYVIRNLSGVILNRKTLKINAGTGQHAVDVSELQPGMYLLDITLNGNREVMKFVH